MRVGIVCSGYEMMPLLQLLQTYDISYDIFMDWKMWPWGDKSYDLQKERVDIWVKYLLEQVNVDTLILPPLFEHAYMSSGNSEYILPIFTQYLTNEVLPFSIVWKLGLLCDSTTIDESQVMIRELCSWYTLNAKQIETKSFHTTFPVWSRSVSMWNYFLTTYGKREWMVRKAIKYDLRYFKDAAVDTLIPLSWWHLFYEKIIRQHTQWKKIRFHGKKAVKLVLDWYLGSSEWAYSMTLHMTDKAQPLLDEQKRMDMLGRGKADSVIIKQCAEL